MHFRSHTKERPFSCIRCNRGFSQNDDLLKHLVTEACIRAERYIRRTGKGWECTKCENELYQSRDQAERHARMHELGKGLSCPVCPTNYNGQKANVLVSHVKQCHPQYLIDLGIKVKILL